MHMLKLYTLRGRSRLKTSTDLYRDRTEKCRHVSAAASGQNMEKSKSYALWFFA